MRRTPREDIEWIEFFIERDRQKHWYTPNTSRYFHKHLTSLELGNILCSMGVDVDRHNSFSTDDNTYIKALDILKLMLEEGQ